MYLTSIIYGLAEAFVFQIVILGSAVCVCEVPY